MFSETGVTGAEVNYRRLLCDQCVSDEKIVEVKLKIEKGWLTFV